MHLTPEAPRSSIRALEDYSRTLGSFKSASPSGFKVNRCRPPRGAMSGGYRTHDRCPMAPRGCGRRSRRPQGVGSSGVKCIPRKGYPSFAGKVSRYFVPPSFPSSQARPTCSKRFPPRPRAKVGPSGSSQREPGSTRGRQPFRPMVSTSAWPWPSMSTYTKSAIAEENPLAPASPIFRRLTRGRHGAWFTVGREGLSGAARRRR